MIITPKTDERKTERYIDREEEYKDFHSHIRDVYTLSLYFPIKAPTFRYPDQVKQIIGRINQTMQAKCPRPIGFLLQTGEEKTVETTEPVNLAIFCTTINPFEPKHLFN
ncbi:hypothetical protein PHYBLDRAFT_68641 [Phycomyces blakesleeanus NRRL 1555(-)]|uniref:Uncharacterized protein n=1 Tax=Phycomyces blakesleeanus (strain ATCC 8743b / DSM 1359 / FGSC 10004 / NBRC 33097 / NRRL 1555) TaxID=763407 RepID=A0A167M870_PHYB8|nr:hypothetical protein PHYBLDRAFT_68641 [Phycomyces blakesleeanus NRRL 1555(-)]OAD72089.1 hypothetical protein PHYBLDRAFT_68641 [Phycomyces blakesleeanus NRRL 1555(-)]|eukprot:XP_018290129.1 hypothetical protein PHYBLDRAFT_68641 [Phycomyces blakesleeanus NRRL 1555(-)]